MIEELLKHVGSRGIETFLEAGTKLLSGRLIPRGGDPYLWRYYLRETEEFGVYLHKFTSSDDPSEIHNHPWEWSMSIILTNGYIEVRPRETPMFGVPYLGGIKTRILFPFDINIINHDDYHSVKLVANRPTWTLFIHGPRISKWGFFKIETGEYTGVTVRTSDRPEVNQGVLERWKKMVLDEIDSITSKIFGEPEQR